MERPTCRTCPYWYPGFDDERGEDCDPADPDIDNGDCRRHAPMAKVKPHGEKFRNESVLWPDVGAADWCGSHPLMAAYVADSLARQETP